MLVIPPMASERLVNQQAPKAGSPGVGAIPQLWDSSTQAASLRDLARAKMKRIVCPSKEILTMAYMNTIDGFIQIRFKNYISPNNGPVPQFFPLGTGHFLHTC